MHATNERVEEFTKFGVTFKIYFAPEALDQSSQPQAITANDPRWRDEFGIDLTASYMIGDKALDVECGTNAGVS